MIPELTCNTCDGKREVLNTRIPQGYNLATCFACASTFDTIAKALGIKGYKQTLIRREK